MILIWVALAGCFATVVSVFFYARKINQQMQLAQQQSAETIKHLQHELDIVNSAAMGVGQGLINTEKKLKQLAEKQQQLQAMNGDELSYKLVASMAQQGVAVDQLVERYGLPEAEASLLTLLKSRAG